MQRITHWFWSPVREGENWAQTLVRVLGNLIRSGLTLILIGVVWIVAWQHFESLESDKERDEVERIKVSVRAHGKTGCSDAFPIAVTVRNRSNRALMRTDITLIARSPGTSTNLLDYGDRTLSWDHIVPPAHVLTLCYRVRNPLPADAVFSTEQISYLAETKAPENWMLRETQATPFEN